MSKEIAKSIENWLIKRIKDKTCPIEMIIYIYAQALNHIEYINWEKINRLIIDIRSKTQLIKIKTKAWKMEIVETYSDEFPLSKADKERKRQLLEIDYYNMQEREKGK